MFLGNGVELAAIKGKKQRKTSEEQD